MEEFEFRESDLLAQIKKHIDLVKHLELEANQANLEKEQFKADRINSEQKLESILAEFNKKIFSEKELVVNNFESQLKELNEQVCACGCDALTFQIVVSNATFFLSI